MPDIADSLWAEVDDLNSDVAPNGFPPGMPAYIDQIGRMMMGAIKRSWGRENPVYETTGSEDAYIVSPASGPNLINLFEIIRVRIDRANTTTTPTFQYGMTNPRTIMKIDATGKIALAAGDLVAGNAHGFWYDGTDWVLINPGTIEISEVPGLQTALDAKLQRVADRAGIAALADTNAAAYLLEAGREGNFVWSGSNLSAAVTVDTQQAVYIAPSFDTTGASGAWVRERDDLVIYPDWCGAAGDGATDDKTAFQAAIDFVSSFGGTVALRAKKYVIASPLTLALPNVGLADCAHVKLRGEGGALTVLRYTGPANSQFLKITGPSWAQTGVTAKLRIAGITFDGVDYTKKGLWLERCINYEFNDVHFIQWEEGHHLVDVVLGNYLSCSWTFNVAGIYAEPGSTALSDGTGSPPNELTFLGCMFSNNRGYAAWFNYSAPVTFIGGSIEENGIPGAWNAIANRWGIRIDNGGFNGATPLNMFGVHTETNAGDADVYIVHGSAEACVYNINSIDFIHNGNVNYVNNSIILAMGDGSATLNVSGCGFNHVNGYVPDGSRPRIGIFGTLEKLRINIDPSCRFSSDVDAPVTLISDTLAQSIQSCVTAAARFTTGSAPVLAKSNNVASVTHSGTGIYVITLSIPLENEQILYFASIAPGPGSANIEGFSGGAAPASFTIHTYDSGGTLADVGTEVSFMVVGGLS